MSVSRSGQNHPAQIPGNTMCEPKQENDARKGQRYIQKAVRTCFTSLGTKGDVDCAKAATVTTAEHVYT